MNYKKGLFRIWVVVACVILAWATIISIDQYTAVYKRDIYLHRLSGPNEIAFNSNTCSDRGEWHEVLHTWERKGTRFRYIVCGVTKFRSDAQRQQFIDDTVNDPSVIKTANDDHNGKVRMVIEYFQMAAWMLGIWIAILISVAYVARGFAKPKS